MRAALLVVSLRYCAVDPAEACEARVRSSCSVAESAILIKREPRRGRTG